MLTQRKELNFEGQNIYVGIDVHLKSWTVSIYTDQMYYKTITQPPKAEILAHYLKENFPNGNYFSAYEAGFSGFWAHYMLLSEGITNIVINPSDVPTTQKEQYQKTDPVDSKKIARSLRSQELIPIHILSSETLEDRSLIRVRNMLVQDMIRFKQRIKSFLYFYGITYPKEFFHSTSHWSRRFLRWIKEDVSLTCESGRYSLNLLVVEVENHRKLLLETNRKIRTMCQSQRYVKEMELLKSIPGIGTIGAITFLTQMENIERFKNIDHLSSYVGLIPNRHSSGEHDNKTDMTVRGHRFLKTILVESAWIAIRVDPALTLSYHSYVKRMPPNKAIIRIARKLLNRMYYVLKEKRPYVHRIVK